MHVIFIFGIMEKIGQFLKNNRLYILVFIALLPIMVLRDFTPDNELRYLSISDEALRNGTWFMFTNHGIPYADKPPLYFWIIMLSKLIFGSYHMWFLSLFSIIPSFIIAKTLNKWTQQEVQPAEITPSATRMLLTCGLFMGSAIFLRMDMLMCMFIVLSLHSFYQMLTKQEEINKQQWLFPIYVFLAIFSKGPMGFLIPLLVTIVYLFCTKRIKELGRYWGWRTWSVLLTGCFIWFGLAYLEGGSDYLNNMLFHQTVGRAVNSFHHERPFYWYLKSMWYTFLPWSILTIGTILTVIVKRQAHSEIEKFFLTTIAVIFILCSCISSKIDIYLLPVYPFWIYFTAFYMFKTEWKHWTNIGITIPAVVFIAALPVIICLSGTAKFHFLQHPCFYIAAGILTLTGLATLFQLFKSKECKGTVSCFTNGLFIALFIGGWGIPSMNDTLGYGTMCNAAFKIGQENKATNFVAYKIKRPENMDVFLHHEIKEVSPDQLQQTSLQNTVLLVSTKQLPEIERITKTKACWKTNQHAIILLK